MENTLANKAIFFAQYLGNTAISKITNAKLVVGWALLYDIVNGQFDLWSMLLKPLSSITYEDAYNAGIPKMKLKKHILHPSIMTPFIVDYLRSKGYALPYMGLSVEKQIEYGWVKLEELNND